MSRSYRKPYASVCGNRSAHEDKTFAARSFRRLERRVLKKLSDFEEYLHPVQLDASHNNPYSWSRDGKQRLQFPPDLNYYDLYLEKFSGFSWATPEYAERRRNQAIQYYERLKRK